MTNNQETDIFIGAHTSAAGGSFNALIEGKDIGANTIQLFTSNQKTWAGRTISEEEIAHWKKALEETNIQKVMSHASYLINLGSPKQDVLEKSKAAFKKEIERCHTLGISFLNFHPGSALDSTAQACMDCIISSILELKETVCKGKTRLLLEATAGQGSNVGYTFEQLAYLIQRLENSVPIGVCIDTCHIFAAGYDIRTKKGWEDTLKEFDDKVGLKHLYALHVNDSKFPLGSRKDRHAALGEGEIGIESFKAMMQNPLIRRLPLYIETPEGLIGFKKEIAMLREFSK